jgi:hypothetical protein
MAIVLAAMPPQAPPAQHVWEPGECADVLLRPAPCTPYTSDGDDNGGAVWFVTAMPAWEPGQDANLQRCGEPGAVAYTLQATTHQEVCWESTRE